MINLRYHIVSITAVFLALGIGIAMGSSFLGAAALDRVDSNIQNARAEAAAARTQRDDLRREVGRDDQVASEMLSEGAPTMFTNDLSDVPVVVLTVGGIDGDSLDALQTGLTSSRAALDGTLRLNDSLVDEGSAAELADLVDSNATGGAALRADVVDAVAAELTDLAVAESDPADGVPPESTTEPPATSDEPATTTDEPPSTTEPPASAEPTIIRALVDAGFLEWEPAPGQEDAPVLGGDAYRYVVVTGPQPDVADADFLLPLLVDMTADGPAPVVVASAATGDDPEAREAGRALPVAAIRDDDDLRDRISTVDDLEIFEGLAAVMLVIDDLDGVQRGHYGLGEGRDSLLPEPAQ